MAEGDPVSQVDETTVSASSSTTVDFRPSSGVGWAVRSLALNVPGGDGEIRLRDFTNSSTILSIESISAGGTAENTVKRHFNNEVAIQIQYDNTGCSSETYNSSLTGVEF